MILIIFFIFSVIAFIIGYGYYKDAIGNTIRSNKSTVNLLANIIREHQKAAFGIIDSYRRNPVLVNEVKNNNFNGIIRHLNLLKENNPEIDRVFVTDKYGILRANFPVHIESLGRNLSHLDWYKGVSTEWKPYISRVYRRIIAEKDIVIAVSAPIFDEKGNVIGILGTSQRTVFLGNFINQIEIEPDTKITIIDPVGQIIYSNRFIYEKEIIMYPLIDFVKKAGQGQKNDFKIKDPSDDNRTKYVSFAAIKGIGWSAIVEKGEKEVLKSLTPHFILISVISILLYALITISLNHFRKELIYKQMIQLKRAEDELIEKERRYSTLLQNINLIAVGIDIKGNITYTNPFLLKLTGYNEEEIIGNNFFDIFLPERLKKTGKNVFQKFITDGLHTHYESSILTKSGEEKIILWNNTLLKDITGNILGTMRIGENITERKRAEVQLRSSYDQLQRLSAHLQSVREEERIKIAREIHDELGQTLTGFKIDLSWLQNKLSKNSGIAPPITEKLNSMLQLTNNIIHWGRKLSTELRPSVLDDLGLIPAIEWQANEFSARTGIICTFTSSGENLDLIQEQYTALFRICQESLTNVARHANATEVTINLKESEGILILEINDNGKGIKNNDIINPKSFGLLGIKERAISLGGDVTIIGNPDKGTKVIVRIPLKRSQ